MLAGNGEHTPAHLRRWLVGYRCVGRSDPRRLRGQIRVPLVPRLARSPWRPSEGVGARATGAGADTRRAGTRSATAAEEQAQPYVVVYAEPTPEHPHFVDLIVENFGGTAARDVSVTIEPPLFRNAGGETKEVKGPGRISTLVPGQEWRTFWDSTLDRAQLADVRHTATVKFRDSRDRSLGPYTFDLDWEHILERGWITTYGMNDLAGAARDVRDMLKRWQVSQNALRVVAYDGDERDERECKQWEERRTKREAQAPSTRRCALRMH
jgi:hypothetical protein